MTTAKLQQAIPQQSWDERRKSFLRGLELARDWYNAMSSSGVDKITASYAAQIAPAISIELHVAELVKQGVRESIASIKGPFVGRAIEALHETALRPGMSDGAPTNESPWCCDLHRLGDLFSSVLCNTSDKVAVEMLCGLLAAHTVDNVKEKKNLAALDGELRKIGDRMRVLAYNCAYGGDYEKIVAGRG